MILRSILLFVQRIIVECGTVKFRLKKDELTTKICDLVNFACISNTNSVLI
uniref:Uncharacterized protein n=1 Tax=Heterorhabditis bacteriophora TaxID=37862 RepID=A0A1I7X2Y6_HETBA